MPQIKAVESDQLTLALISRITEVDPHMLRRPTNAAAAPGRKAPCQYNSLAFAPDIRLFRQLEKGRKDVL
jgi:hypothetical protein